MIYSVLKAAFAAKYHRHDERYARPTDIGQSSEWFNASGQPANSLGEVNDYFIDNDTGDYYQKTDEDTWSLLGNLEGPQGPSGSGASDLAGFRLETLAPPDPTVGQWTTVPFNSEVHDQGDTGVDAANNKHALQDDKAGLWHYDIAVKITTSDDFEIRLREPNGPIYAQAEGNGWANISTDWYFGTVGVDVQVEILVNSATSIDPLGGGTFFAGHLLIPPTPPTNGTYDGQVASGPDDAHETAAGTNFNHSAVTLRVEPSTTDTSRWNVGARFNGVDVPQAANIPAAHCTVVFPASQRDSPRLRIYGHLVPNSSDFATLQDVTGRLRTTNFVAWSGDDLGSGVPVQSPDISSVIQEIVNQPTWVEGNSITLLFIADSVNGPEATRFTPHDQAPGDACQLHIEWETL